MRCYLIIITIMLFDYLKFYYNRSRMIPTIIKNLWSRSLIIRESFITLVK